MMLLVFEKTYSASFPCRYQYNCFATQQTPYKSRCNCTDMRRLHQRSIFRQHASRTIFSCWRPPGGLARCHLFIRDVYGKEPPLRVQRDDIAVLDEPNRSAHCSLGADVADHDAVRRAAEATVGYQRNVLTETATDKGSAWHEHLWHTWRSFWPLVTHDDHVATHDPPRNDRLVGRVLLVKALGWACVVDILLSRELADSRVW